MHIYLSAIVTIRFLEVGPARRSAGKGRVKKEYTEHRVYKYMHIYLWTVLTIHVFWVWDLMWRDKTGGEWIW